MDDHYIERFTYTSSLRRGNSITLKVTSTLGYSMNFVLLSLMTRSEAQCTSWFIPQMTADGTKDSSWPFETGIPSIGFMQEWQDTHRYDDTLHCHEATCDKINFMYLIIQCKNISCNKFVFKEKNENILTMTKDRSMVRKTKFVYMYAYIL